MKKIAYYSLYRRNVTIVNRYKNIFNRLLKCSHSVITFTITSLINIKIHGERIKNLHNYPPKALVWFGLFVSPAERLWEKEGM